ncbi:MAG: endopeptidase La [Acidobacteriota bacterium]
MPKRLVGEHQTLPLLPLRDVVIFPGMMMPFVVGRPRSVAALERAMESSKRLFLAAQKDAEVDDPEANQVYSLGTIAIIVQSLKQPNGNIRVLVEGAERARAIEYTEEDAFHEVVVKPLVPASSGVGAHSKAKRLTRLFEKYVKLSANLPHEAMLAAVKKEDPGRLADTIAAHLNVDLAAKQELLEIVDVETRLAKLIEVVSFEIEKLRVDKKIQGQVKKQMEQAQKEYYLSEKMKAIQRELGRKEGKGSEADQLRARIAKAQMPADVEEKALQELERLEAMPPMSAEATVSRNYIDWLASVPWYRRTRENTDLKLAAEILDEDHFGLKKIKERIIEFLAVRQLVETMKGSILCFVGGPGVGKSSLGRSIARATGRDFVRLSLGGVRDEAEIRGHRRTYIGAFPGQIMQRMKMAGVINPVFLLDEVDKMSMDFRGDPSSALMEVLDPEQNNTFVDHYLDCEYDLSHVMFITTANVMHTIPAALQDRMEIIRLSGYTQREKMEIAKRHLVAKQVAYHGLAPSQLEITDGTLDKLIDEYTREAGVRNLEREIARLCRKGARDLVEKYSDLIAAAAANQAEEEIAQRAQAVSGEEAEEAEAAAPVDGGAEPREGALFEKADLLDADNGPTGLPGSEEEEEQEEGAIVEARNPMERMIPRRTPIAEAIPAGAKILIDIEQVEEYLGVPRFKRKQKEERPEVGLAAGLAWTERGGEILAIEATLMPGKGKLSLTGQLGDIMQESGKAALSYVRSRAAELNISKEFHRHFDIHVHVPEGAIPKDGPSAGITLATSIVSALTGIPIHNDIAMTGEITLRGKVLPIGGVKEKVLAAHRAGLNRIILPAENEKDLKEVPEEVREDLTVYFVGTMDEVLRLALISPLAPMSDGEKGGLPPRQQPDKPVQPPLTH